MDSEMDNQWSLAMIAVATAVAGVAVAAVLYVLRCFEEGGAEAKAKHESMQAGSSSGRAAPQEKKREGAAAGRAKKRAGEVRRPAAAPAPHPWLLASLKGHSGRVLDVDLAANGKFLASCADDRTVFLWDTKDFTQKDRKSLRVNIEFDYATFVKWSPDSKAFVIHRYNENCIEVYKVEKKKDGWLAAIKALTFPKHHTTDVIGAAIASNGKFIMTCSNKTDLIIWDLKGEKMATVDTCLMTTTCAKISPCGRFVVASGFTPEAKVWEVSFTKSGEFQDVKPVVSLTLGGHTSGVYDVAFDVDSSHMATVSKDGTWRLFDTKVNYKQGQDARLEKSEKYELSGSHSLIALSPNAEVIVIAASNSLAFYSTHSGKLDNTIEDAFEDDITAILFDASGKYFLASGDKHIKVFHNVTGYRCAIETAKEKLKEHQTSATKERLQQLISDSQAFLEKIGEK